VLAAIARQLTTARVETVQARASAGWDHTGLAAVPQHPPTPLPGYQLIEITITRGSPAAGRTLADVAWPPGSTPVTVLRGHRLRPPQPELTLAPGDRVSLLTASSGGSSERDPGGRHRAGLAVDGTSHRA